MTTMTVTGAQATTTQHLAPPPETRTAPASLLVSPESTSTLATADAITQLLKFSSDLSAQQMQIGKGEAEVADAQRKTASQERKEALAKAVEEARKAREAADDGIFSAITDNLGLTGLVGLATFNFSLVAVDVAAHKAGLANGSTGIADLGLAIGGNPLLYLGAKGLEKLAPDAMNSTAFTAMLLTGPAGYAIERAVEKLAPDDFEKSLEQISSVKDQDVRVANKVAFMAAMTAVAATSAVLSAGTSTPALVLALSGVGISTATQVGAQTGATQAIFGEEAAGYITIGGAAVGAALSLGGAAVGNAASAAQTADAAKNVASTLKTAKTVVAAATSITKGAASVEGGLIQLNVARHQRNADHASADAQEARNALQRLEQVVDKIIADLEEAKDSSRRSTEILQQTLQTYDQTILMAGSMKV